MNFSTRARVALVAVAVAVGGIGVINSGVAAADWVDYPSEEACQAAKPPRKASTDPIYSCEWAREGVWHMYGLSS